MSSDTDAWLERRMLARRATRWRIVAVLALLVLALIGLWRLDPGNLLAQRQAHVARLEISGTAQAPGPQSGGMPGH